MHLEHRKRIGQPISMRAKVYLSDEGFGHIVRQRAIIEAIRRRLPEANFVLQTHKHAEMAGKVIEGVELINKFNNIVWHKLPNGSPDVEAITNYFHDYESISDQFIQEEAHLPGVDFILSDFVYEAFAIGQNQGIPSFGVAHFTWDWFFSKLYPPPMNTRLMQRFFTLAKSAEMLYFPPFTPEEILNFYKGNCREVPLIVRTEVTHKSPHDSGRFKVMILDSGAGVLRQSVEQALATVAPLDDFEFFVSSNYLTESANVTFIDKNELMVDYLRHVDLVISRAGFNTISECISLRTPMLLIGEAMNPEMSENILNLKKVGLASFISTETFESELDTFLPKFIQHEYPTILEAMNNHTMPLNGAEVIADDILERLQCAR